MSLVELLRARVSGDMAMIAMWMIPSRHVWVADEELKINYHNMDIWYIIIWFLDSGKLSSLTTSQMLLQHCL